MMEMNAFAILLAAVTSMVIGSLWYGPLFGKPWMKEMGIKKPTMDAAGKKKMMRSYTLMFVGSLVMSYVLYPFIWGWASNEPDVSPMNIALQTGFWLWLGLIAPILMGGVLWEDKSWKLYFINVGYWLVTLLAMCAVLVSL